MSRIVFKTPEDQEGKRLDMEVETKIIIVSFTGGLGYWVTPGRCLSFLVRHPIDKGSSSGAFHSDTRQSFSGVTVRQSSVVTEKNSFFLGRPEGHSFRIGHAEDTFSGPDRGRPETFGTFHTNKNIHF